MIFHCYLISWLGYSWVSQFAWRSLVLDIHNLLIYQGCPSVSATGEWGRDVSVWRVTTWYEHAFGAPWYEECLWGRCSDAWDASKFENHCIFWIVLCQNIGHIFCTRFCIPVDDNQVIWPAYNFFQQFLYWPFIMIYLTLDLLWNKYILYKFLLTFLKIEWLVIYNFPILVMGLIFDRGSTPVCWFFY